MRIINHIIFAFVVIIIVVVGLIYAPNVSFLQNTSSVSAQTPTPQKISGTLNWVFKSTKTALYPTSTFTTEQSGTTHVSLVLQDGVWKDDNTSTITGTYVSNYVFDSNSGQCIIKTTGSASNKLWHEIRDDLIAQGFHSDWQYGFVNTGTYPIRFNVNPGYVEGNTEVTATANAYCAGFSPKPSVQIIPPTQISGGTSTGGSGFFGRILDVPSYPTVGFDRHEEYSQPDGAGSVKFELDVTGILSSKPVAQFTYEQRAGGTYFDASASAPAAGIKSYHWDFGDGESLITELPTTYHKFTSQGPHTVRLTVTDTSDVLSDPETQDITVCTSNDAFPVLLPAINISYGSIKPVGIKYDSLPLTFNGTQSISAGSTCSLTSTGNLKVTMNLNTKLVPGIYQEIDVPINSNATATFDFLDGSEQPVPVCDWKVVRHDCSVNQGGASKTLVKWHTNGFRETLDTENFMPDILLDVKEKLSRFSYTSDPMTYYAYVSSRSTIQEAISEAEPLLHTTLTHNLGFINPVFVIQDPPNDLLVTNSSGKMTGISSPGSASLTDIPDSLFVKANDGYSAVLLFKPESAYTVELAGTPGNSYVLSMIETLPKAQIDEAQIVETSGVLGSSGQVQTCFGSSTECNSAPTVSEIQGSQTVTEANNNDKALTYAITATDPDNDTLSYSWSIESSKASIKEGANTSSVTVNFFDGPAEANLQVKVDDSKGHVVTKTMSINIANVPPSIGAIQATGITGTACTVGNPVTLSFAVLDPAATVDEVTTSINWGDGTTNNYSTDVILANHNYKPGTYTAVVTSQDKDNGKDNKQQTIARQFALSALLPPFNGDGSSIWSPNATIPVKVTIKDCENKPVPDLAPQVSTNLINAANVISNVNEESTGGTYDTNNIMRYDVNAGQYIYNFRASSLSDQSATYEMVVKGTNKDGKVVTAPSSVKEKFGLKIR